MSRDYRDADYNYKLFVKHMANVLKKVVDNMDPDNPDLDPKLYECDIKQMRKEVDYQVKLRGMQALVKELGITTTEIK